ENVGTTCRYRITERALRRVIQGDGHWISIRVEDLDLTGHCRCAVIEKSDLGSPSSSDGELRNHDRRASASRCNGADDGQCAEFDSRETQSQHGEWSLALQMKAAG